MVHAASITVVSGPGMPRWTMNSPDLAVVQRSAQLRATTCQLVAESQQFTEDLRDTYMELLNDIKNAHDSQFLTPHRSAR